MGMRDLAQRGRILVVMAGLGQSRGQYEGIVDTFV
jgi:hypothetical protein